MTVDPQPLRGSRYEFQVPPADAGARLDVWLAGQDVPFSRSQITRRITEGEVQVDGAAGKPSQKLRAGQRVSFAAPPPRAVADQPEALPLDILFEDAHLIVINKAAGMVVHPAPGHESGTLVNALLHHCGALPLPPAYTKAPHPPSLSDPADAAEPEDDPDEGGAALSIGGERRPGIVHRLDGGTSGVLVCAKDEPTLIGLQAQFQVHSIDRQYLALCEGVAPQEATFHTRYGRHPQDRKRFTGRGGSRHAITHYRVEERLCGASLLSVRLETGRTHQIRVHLSEANLPILGDPLYGRRPRAPQLREVAALLTRQALHAALLGFTHPVSGERLRFRAPPPPDMEEALARLRAP